MPITKSAKKAVRQNIARRKKNLSRKLVLRAALKQYKNLLSGKIEEAKKYLPQVYKRLDKAVKANLISKNKASRLKSRLTKKLATGK